MKLFSCSSCQHLAFFENVTCVACGHELAYLPDRNTVAALEPADGDVRVAVGTDARYRLCTNRVEHGACNWAISADSADTLCMACRFTEVIPPLSTPEGIARWVVLETAKRRLFYTLLSLGLPLERRADVKGGLAFAFKQDTETEKVMTGHADGLITVNVAEADAPFREQQRVHMHETYRTVLGHLRHEVGHYYWSRLVENTWDPLESTCRHASLSIL